MIRTPLSELRKAQIKQRALKALPAIAIAAFVAAAVTILPSFAPPPETTTLAKGDRIRPLAVDPACAGQNWPNINASCLSHADAASVPQARPIAADRPKSD